VRVYASDFPLNVEFGDEVRFTYVLGDLARKFGPVLPIMADGTRGVRSPGGVSRGGRR
jgi:hypothetical protein